MYKDELYESIWKWFEKGQRRLLQDTTTENSTGESTKTPPANTPSIDDEETTLDEGIKYEASYAAPIMTL
jgi:hypothetical protein